MILLTPEETNKSYEDGIVAWGIAENPQYDDETYAYLAIAKAQAKKILDELKDRHIIGLTDYTSLLKECE